MADRIKNYEIQYNILSNATQAAEGFASLLEYVEKLSGKDPSNGMSRGLTKLNGEINQVVNSVNRLKTSFTEIRPEIDMSGFRSQIGQMQRAVSEFAQQTRNIMRMAMSGTDKQFAKARSAMAGDIFDAASLRHFEEQLKLLPQRITAAQKAVEDAKAKYNQAVNTPITYPKGSTSEDQKNIAAAAKKERAGLQKIWQDREKELKALQNQQENYQRQAYNLRSSLSQEAMRPIAAPREEPRIPAGVQKAVGLIPRWQKEYEQARAAALVKRAELAGSMREPQRVAKPSFYGIKSPFGGGGIDSYLREYEQAFNRNAASNSVAQQRIMADAKTNFMALGGYNETQFAEALRQYQAYEQYRTAYGNWVRAGRPQGQAYNETEEYKNYRSSLKRLRAAYGAQRQGEALKARMAATATTAPAGSAAGGGGPLPPILGMPTQVIEQAFTGKLTLLPDIPAAKALIAAESFSANLNLVPMISELRAKLNSEKFEVNVTPIIAKTRGKAAATGGAVGTLQEEINALQQSAKAPITVSTKLDRGGLLGRAQGGYNTLQALANRHPISYKLASDGSGGFSLNQALARLTELAKSRPVRCKMVHDGSGGFALNQALARLQSLANTRPIQLKTALSGNGTINVNSIKPTGSVNVPLRGVLYKKNITPPSTPIQVKVAAKIAGGNNKNFGLNINTLGLESKVAQLERLRTVWASLPRTGSRTYTVNLKTTGLENIARLEQLLRLVNKMPPSDRRSYNIAARVSETGGRTTTIGAIGGSRRTPVYTKSADDFYTRSRKWAYPFTGNTSFGARTPAAFDMMKGMGVMMGIGGAMGVIGGSFSDAVNYQNVMETAKAILRDNYKGNNFNSDYADMVRVVRDVAMRTKFTAPEAADAARFMAMAGLDIPAIKGAISPIADVAAISDMDLGIVADKMTNIMTTYQRSPEQMRNLADMMTKTFTSTNTDMMMLAESLQYAGPMAFASGQSLAETLAMIGIMGNSGIQASMAGTTMRMMLQNLYNPNKNQAKFMQQIGLRTRDANGNRRSLFEILSDISRLTGSNDTRNVVGNLLSGKDAKNNLDTFDAASKLFRVTAAAGGASLLGNIGGLAELIAKIQGASGNSAAVSLAKQNTVAGMWAQAKSAFTEAVVKVFEDNDMQKYIKDTLGGLIKYLKEPEFIKTIRDLFDLIKGIGEALKWFVGAWIKVYQTIPTITKWVMIMQMAGTQIGYLITPFTQLIGLVSSLLTPLTAVGSIGSRSVLSGISAISNIESIRRAKSVNEINKRFGSDYLNPMSGPAMAIAAHNASKVKADQLKWRLRNTVYGSAAPGVFWSMAYTNPERIAMRSRAANRAEQMAIRHATEIRNIKGDAATSAMMAWAAAQNSGRRSADVFNRYERIYGRAYNSDFFGRGGRAAASWSRGITAGRAAMAIDFSSIGTTLLNGIRGIISKIGFAFGALTSPLGIAGLAIGAFATAAILYTKKLKKQAEEFRIRNERNEKISGATAANIGHRQTEQINEIRKNMGLINLTGKLTPINSTLKAGQYKVDPMLKNNARISSYFGQNAGNKSDFAKKGLQLIEDMSTVVYGRRLNERDVRQKYWGVTDTDYFRNDVALAAVALAGANSQYAQKAAKPIQERLKAWASIQNKEKSNEEWDKIVADAKAVAERYNPSGKNLTDLRGKSSSYIGNLRTSAAANTLQYQQGIYQGLSELTNPDNPLYGSYIALHELKNMTETQLPVIFDLIGRIAGAVNFTLPDVNGIEKQLNLQFINGTITYERFQTRLAALGITVPNDVMTFYDMLANIYGSMQKTLQDAGQDMGMGNFVLGAAGGSVKAGGTLTDNQVKTFVPWLKEWIEGSPGYKAGVIKKYGSIDNYLNRGSYSETDINKAIKYHYDTINGGNIKNSPTPTNNNGNKQVTPQPIARVENPNKGYESSYAQNAARPTQVVINIDKLMNTDKMLIASDAEERQLAGAMEDKIEQALDILKSQIVMSLQRGDYSMS